MNVIIIIFYFTKDITDGGIDICVNDEYLKKE